METFNAIINVIANNGLAIVLASYFLFKDFKQTTQIINVLGELRELMAVLKNNANLDRKE